MLIGVGPIRRVFISEYEYLIPTTTLMDSRDSGQVYTDTGVVELVDFPGRRAKSNSLFG